MRPTYFLLTILLSSVVGCGSGDSSSPENGGLNDTQNEPATSSSSASFVPPAPPPQAKCSSYDVPTLTESQGFYVGNIVASYYHEDDINEDIYLQSYGHDGHDPSIIKTLMHTEEVDYLTLPDEREIHGVPSDNLVTVWEGNIVVEDDSATALFTIETGRSNTSIYIDNELIDEGYSCDTVIPVTLAKGEHTFRIQHHTHYFIPNFKASFTGNIEQSLSELKSTLGLTDTTPIPLLFVSAYSDQSNETTIVLPRRVPTGILILDADKPTVWTIENPAGMEVPALFFTEASRGSRVVGLDNSERFSLAREDDQGPPSRKSIAYLNTLEDFDVVYAASKRTNELTINSDSNVINSSIFKEDIIILDNPFELTFDLNLAESRVGGQELAAYFELDYAAVIDELSWSGEISNTSSFFRTYSFTFAFFSGSAAPASQQSIFTEYENIKAIESIETNGGQLYGFELIKENMILLPAGSHWLSIAESLRSENGFSWLFNQDPTTATEGKGGAFRPEDDIFWLPISPGVDAVNSAAPNLYIKGRQLWENPNLI